MDLVVFENNKPWVIDEFREGRFDYIELASDVAETKFFQFLFAHPAFRGGVSRRFLRALQFSCDHFSAVVNPPLVFDILHAAMILNILNLIDDAKCFETVRQIRWPDEVTCPHCASPRVTKQGHDETQPARRKYAGTACRRRFDDLTGTIFAGHHRPLRTWILGLYFMGLNLSNEQIAQELDLNSDDAQKMTSQLREGIVGRTPEVTLSGEVECDEVYVTAGHKGHPEAVKKKGARGGDAG